MNAIVTLFALVLDRTLPALDARRAHPWFSGYHALMREQFGTMREWGGVAPVLLVAGVPAALTALALWFLHAAHPWLAAFGGMLIVLFMLGPVGLNRAGAAYVRALDSDADALPAAETLLGGPAPDDPIARNAAVARALAIEAVTRTYGPALWAALAGPAGAVLWRCAVSYQGRLVVDDTTPAAQQAAARELYGVLGWLPARALALACALAGRADDAFAEWRAWRRPAAMPLLEANAEFIARVAGAALGFEADDEDGGSHLLSSMLALLDRALVLWCAVLGFVWGVLWLA